MEWSIWAEGVIHRRSHSPKAFPQPVLLRAISSHSPPHPLPLYPEEELSVYNHAGAVICDPSSFCTGIGIGHSDLLYLCTGPARVVHFHTWVI